MTHRDFRHQIVLGFEAALPGGSLDQHLQFQALRCKASCQSFSKQSSNSFNCRHRSFPNILKKNAFQFLIKNQTLLETRKTDPQNMTGLQTHIVALAFLMLFARTAAIAFQQLGCARFGESILEMNAASVPRGQLAARSLYVPKICGEEAVSCKHMYAEMAL